VWFDRSGRELAQIGPPGLYISPRISRDGRRLAVTVIEQLQVSPDVWIFDTTLRTGVRTKGTDGPDIDAVFSPDGARIFSAGSRGVWNIFETPTSGTGESKPVLESALSKWPHDLSPDGRLLLYREFSPSTRGDLKILPLVGERRPYTYLASQFDEDAAVFSPDGRWVAYVSDDSGRKEVYVASFPEPSRRHRISTDGGTQPRWRSDGRELYFVTSSRTFMAVPFESGRTDLPTGAPRRLFDVPINMAFGSNVPFRYDVAPDGRFLVTVRASEEPPPPLVLVLNWQAGLEKK
jgi:Tol biopolymer transport system component